jgi:hypothetical protein
MKAVDFAGVDAGVVAPMWRLNCWNTNEINNSVETN